MLFCIGKQAMDQGRIFNSMTVALPPGIGEILTKPSSENSADGFTFPELAMKKKRLLLFATLPLAVAVIFGVLAMLPPRPGITKASFDRIEIGMTLAEVEEIFGGKGRKGIGIETIDATGKVVAPSLYGMTYEWMDDTKSLNAEIEFVENCVFDKTWTSFNETILDKIRRWLHLP